MIGTRAGWLTVAFAIFHVTTAGCAEQTAATISKGFETKFEERTTKMQAALDKVSEGFSKSASERLSRLNEMQDALSDKYEQHHKPMKLVFFAEDAKVAARPKKEVAVKAVADGDPAKVAVVEIKSKLLSEQTLEHRGLNLIWRLSLDGSGIRYAEFNEGRVYVVTKKGSLFCINGNTGLLQWVYDMGRRPDGAPGFGSEYVVISAGDTIRVIEKATGHEKWRFETDIQPSSRPYVDSEGFAFGCWSGEVCAFKFGDRFPRWRLKTSKGVFNAPILYGGLAFAITDEGSFIRYNSTVRLRLGDVDLGGRPVGDLVGTKDLVFAGSENFEMVAFRVVDGQKAWAHNSGGRFARGPWLSIDNEVVYYSSHEDGLYALTAITGATRWRLADGLSPIALSRSGKNMFALKTDGSICKLNAGTGKVIWSESAKPFTAAIGHLSSDTMYLLSEDGQVFAIKPKQ